MTPTDLVTKVGLYKDLELSNELYHTLFSRGSIDVYCKYCNRISVFTPLDNMPMISMSSGLKQPFEAWRIGQRDGTIIPRQYSCSRDNSHQINLFFEIRGSGILKIGQSPSIADLSIDEISEYEKFLGKENLSVFSKAIGLYSHGIGIGSFVYLRRIVENFIIKPLIQKLEQDSAWDQEAYRKGRMKEKIDLLRTRLPSFLVENSEIYSILSKGIHELSEYECLEMFPVLKEAIIVILGEMKAEQEKNKRKERLENAIKALHQKHC